MGRWLVRLVRLGEEAWQAVVASSLVALQSLLATTCGRSQGLGAPGLLGVQPGRRAATTDPSFLRAETWLKILALIPGNPHTGLKSQ